MYNKSIDNLVSISKKNKKLLEGVAKAVEEANSDDAGA